MTAADAPPGPSRQHFALLSMHAVTRVIRGAAAAIGGEDDLFAELPFLTGYREQLAAVEGARGGRARAPRELDRLLDEHEARNGPRLPLLRLARAANLDRAALTLLVAIGLVEEDARFGSLFARLQGSPALVRPTFGLLGAWWQASETSHAGAPIETREAVWTRLRRLVEIGMVEVIDGSVPRASWSMAVPGPLWDVVCGDAPSTATRWLRHHPIDELSHDEPLVIAAAAEAALARATAVLDAGDVDGVVVRGHAHNGRRTFVRALARRVGRGVLEIEAPARDQPDALGRWRLIAPLACLLDALPVVLAEVGAGETLQVPPPVIPGPIAIVMGRLGGLGGAGIERALHIGLDLPDPALRRAHWARGLGDDAVGEEGERDDGVTLEALTDRFRLTSGQIRRTARLARAHAAAAHRRRIVIDDVRQATRSLRREAFDLLASPIAAAGSWNELALSPETMRELRSLENRCRWRERLPDHVGETLARQLNPGVRALFHGPSGTGKTLAVRLLAAELQMDLYRVDLSAVVSKYIGETEKHLDRLFGLAEELDVMLLLDEGDALLGRRTGVTSANDRYANLETNFLLQRLEAFEGIVLVTTNAPNAIDDAFQRRLDVVVEFRPPEPAERWAIWQLHLPAAHAVDPQLLREVAGRCLLSGGQIRNAVLHAAMLALEDQAGRDHPAPLRTEHLEEALLREYRKIGAICPVRRLSAVSAAR